MQDWQRLCRRRIRVRTANALPFERFDFKDGQSVLDFSLGKREWKCELRTYVCHAIGYAYSQDLGYSVSPDGKWGVFIRNNNLWADNLSTYAKAQLTDDGREHNAYGMQSETNVVAVTNKIRYPIKPVVTAVWSPDSRRFLTYQLDESKMKVSYLIQSVPSGSIVEAVAHSPFANETLIFTIEDDAWDGPDHVEVHRTVALMAGPYLRQHAVVSTRYTTVSLFKTVEEVLGIGPIGLNDALTAPISDVFDPNQSTWSYRAIVPEVLRSTQLPLPPGDHAKIEFPKHSAAYWTKAMTDQDFSGPDRLSASFNRELWQGLKGSMPYPSGADLKANRVHITTSTQPAKENQGE